MSRKYDDKVICDPWRRRVKEHPDKTYLISRFDDKGKRTPETLHKVTWKQADDIVRDFARGLSAMGFKEKDRLAVFGPNRPRWIYSCLAAIGSRGTHVPIYPTSKEEDVWWILFDSGARFAVCASTSLADKAMAVRDRVETLEKIILMDPPPDDRDDFIVGFDEVLEMGRKSGISDSDLDERMDSVMEEDLAAVIYTSGTTGRPKGVMLTHRNLVSQNILADDFGYADDEIFLAHLPMCHSFGFAADFLNAGNIGATLFVADSLDTNEMRRNLKDCRPTFMASVPRLWEKFYITIGQAIGEQTPFKKKLIGWALDVGQKTYVAGQNGEALGPLAAAQRKIAMGLIGKLKAQVGLERLRYSATGGGPIDPKLINFFGGMGIDLYQGFGLTETAPCIVANTPKSNRVGTVGRPLANVEIKIADDGEILVRAPQVMKGYLNNPEATAEAVSPDGWFYTGDIGEIDPDGFLKITDRKKELLITSGGKNIPPQPIENQFNTDPYVEMACAIGDNRKFISALVVPEFDNVRKWLQDSHGELIEDNAKLIEHPKVRELIEERVAIANKDLARYEQIKKFTLLARPFTEETGELTPSQKKKRRVILQKYEKEIEAMYPKD